MALFPKQLNKNSEQWDAVRMHKAVACAKARTKIRPHDPDWHKVAAWHHKLWTGWGER